MLASTRRRFVEMHSFGRSDRSDPGDREDQPGRSQMPNPSRQELSATIVDDHNAVSRFLDDASMLLKTPLISGPAGLLNCDGLMSQR